MMVFVICSERATKLSATFSEICNLKRDCPYKVGMVDSYVIWCILV